MPITVQTPIYTVKKDYQTMDHSKDLNGKKPSYKDLAVEFCGIKMKNPIVAASGTFGFGFEYADYLDLSNEVGAISVKGLTPTPRNGNPGTRIAETPSGVLNCIGLENLVRKRLYGIFYQN